MTPHRSALLRVRSARQVLTRVFSISLLVLALWAVPAAAEASRYEAASRDGSHLYFKTEEAIAEADTTTRSTSTSGSGEACGWWRWAPEPRGGRGAVEAVAPNGSWVHFRRRSASSKEIRTSETTATSGAEARPRFSPPGMSPIPALRVSADGHRMFFLTSRRSIRATPTPRSTSICGSTATSRFSPGLQERFGEFAVDDDGSSFDFSTSEQVDPADTDSQFDVYRRVDGSLCLRVPGRDLSAEVLPRRARLRSDEWRPRLFRKQPALVPEDTDEGNDLYLAENGTLTLIDNASEGYARSRISLPRPRSGRLSTRPDLWSPATKIAAATSTCGRTAPTR